MWRAVLLYSRGGGYEEHVERIHNLLSGLRGKWDLDSSIVEASQITPKREFEFLSDIRSTSPQVRGKVVTSKSFVLPLSGKKKLNLLNTPVLILYESDRPVTVYPHLLGTFYRGVEDSLEEIMKYGPSRAFESRGILEDPICKILADDPTAFGRGVKTVAVEVSTSTGKIDLLLKDDQGSLIVVEIETHADDFSVAQVGRLAAGYSKDNDIDLGKVRRIVVCRSFDKNLIETARSAGVELYKITLTREA